MIGAATRWRADGLATLVSLAAIAAWEASGFDLTLAAWYGNAEGFAWRDAWFTSSLLHQGGRGLAWALLAWLLVEAIRQGADAPGRPARWRWFVVTTGCLLLVPAIKRFSTTSCPWDLARFGGIAAYVPHWQLGVPDGGPGHCFPSGHAVAAFAFFSLYFMWRDSHPRLARRWLAGVLIAGLAFGWAQLARGAHYPSHTLWSAWLCWCLCAGANVLAARLPVQPAGLSTLATAAGRSR